MRLFILVLFLSPLMAQEPKFDFHCTLTNHPVVTVHTHENKKATETEEDDWRVSCTVRAKGEKIFDEALPLGHPTTFRDAMAAVDEFRQKKFPEVVKAWRSDHKGTN